MASKNNVFPGLNVQDIIWMVALWTSMKTYRATELEPEQYDLIEPFLKIQMEENVDYLKQFKRIHLMSFQLEGPDYRHLVNELSPDQPECANGSLYVWVTSMVENLHVIMIHKNTYPRKNRKKKSSATIDTGNVKILKEKLSFALENESYEEAAQLRDAIKNIEDKNN